MTTLVNVAPEKTLSQPKLSPPKTRAQALRSYDVADFPALTGLEEEWRFTPLKRLRGLATVGAGAVVAGPALKHEVALLPDGVSVTSVDRDDPRIGSVLTPFDRISALAFGQVDQALLVSVAKEATPAEPVMLRLAGERSREAPGVQSAGERSREAPGVQSAGGTDGLTFGHTFVEIGPMAEVTLVLEYVGSVTLADNVEIVVGAGAQLTLVTLTEWAPDAVQAQHLKFQLGRDAKVTHVQVTLGGDLVRQYTSVEYADRGGDMNAYGLYFATAGQHQEHRLLVDHAVPDCRSYVGYRGALQGERAHTIWVGDVLIQKEATGTDTYEINRNLLLSDGARADSVPNLEIETGEVVRAGHASTTGRFDDEHLFYLMARGIPEEEARKLVVRGFFAELLAKIPVAELRERLGDAVEARLLGAEAA